MRSCYQKKVLTLSIRMQKSRAEIIELTGRAACSSATIYRQISYVVIVVCKSCLTSLYEFVCSMDGSSAEYDRGLSYLLCRWLNMQMHFHTFAQSADKGKQRREGKREKERGRGKERGGPCRSVSLAILKIPWTASCLPLCKQHACSGMGVYSWPTADILPTVQVITQSASYIV